MSVPWLKVKVLPLGIFLTVGMIFTSLARAETSAFWLVNGSKFTSGLQPTLEAETDTEAVPLTELGGKFVDIKCKKLEFVGAHLTEPTAQFTGKVLYHECDFLSLTGKTPVLWLSCEPFVGANKGLIETNSITESIVLHEGKGALEVKPTAQEACSRPSS